MVTCKDCIHYERCEWNKDMLREIGLTLHLDDGKYKMKAKDCLLFKNKADFVEVKHGYWKDNVNGTFTCSVCGGHSSKMDWCGRCGAKMDGGDN